MTIIFICYAQSFIRWHFSSCLLYQQQTHEWCKVRVHSVTWMRNTNNFSFFLALQHIHFYLKRNTHTFLSTRAHRGSRRMPSWYWGGGGTQWHSMPCDSSLCTKSQSTTIASTLKPFPRFNIWTCYYIAVCSVCFPTSLQVYIVTMHHTSTHITPSHTSTMPFSIESR
jgi:hypothetical protein